MKKLLLIAIAAVFAASPVFALLPVPPGQPGSFNLIGEVTAVDVANRTISVNDLLIRVAPNAIIFREGDFGIPGPRPPFPGDPGVRRPPVLPFDPPILPPVEPRPPELPRPPFLPIVIPPPPHLTLADVRVGEQVEVSGSIERRALLIANMIRLIRPVPFPPFPPIPPFPPLCRVDADCKGLICPMVVGMDTPMCGPDGRCFCGPGRVPYVPVPPPIPPVPPPDDPRLPPPPFPPDDPRFPRPPFPPFPPRPPFPPDPGIPMPPPTPEERARIIRNIQEQINEIARRIEEIRRGIRPPGVPGGAEIRPPVEPRPF